MIRIGDDATQLEFTQTMAHFKIMFPDIEVDAIEAMLRSHNGAVDTTVKQLVAMSVDNEPGGGQGELYYWSNPFGWQAGCYLCCFDNEPGEGQGERTRIRRPNQCAVTSENSPNNGEKEKSEMGKKEKTNPDDLFYPSFLLLLLHQEMSQLLPQETHSSSSQLLACIDVMHFSQGHSHAKRYLPTSKTLRHTALVSIGSLAERVRTFGKSYILTVLTTCISFDLQSTKNQGQIMTFSM